MITKCELCGETIDWESPDPSLSDAAEMYNPDEPNSRVTCHAQCGIDAGLSIS